MQKVEVEVENLKKSWIFFCNSLRAVLFSESQKNIYWASLDVKFQKLSNCIFKNALSLFFTEISWFKVSSDFQQRSRASCAQFPTVVYLVENSTLISTLLSTWDWNMISMSIFALISMLVIPTVFSNRIFHVNFMPP